MTRPARSLRDKEGFTRFLVREVFALILGLARETRLAAEAAAASKWVTFWLLSAAAGGAASLWLTGRWPP